MGTTGIGVAAAVLSFTALSDLAARSGVAVPALWPAIVDGVVVVATVAVVAGAGRYAWGLLIVGALVSVAGNALHAALPDEALPVWLRATVAAVPPVALVAVTHLAVRLRRASSATQTAACDTSVRTSDPICDSGGDEDLVGGGDEYHGTALALTEPTVASPAASRRDTVAPVDEDVAADARSDDAARALAIELLVGGMPAQDVADQVGVHRTTVYRWKRKHCQSVSL
ncbi:helix-turn-helix domain-containing protein [Rhodococcus sp. W8901]|uniref:helix-turn-helix domain-containing protein n=1 Tax=Rhodococcus sp. W8901 TaxID=2742603 RepID=UPI0020C6A13B|nr:helix-turn-helix domain-containing protein [Rhodococcus sp. W8901]